MTFRARRFVSGLLAVAIAAQHIGPVTAAQTMTKADYEACQARDEQSFRAAIEGITSRALSRGVSNIDYKAAVAGQWLKTGMDEVTAKEVDSAVAAISQETSAWNKISSLADKDKAQKIALSVAERVYRSDAMKGAIETLAAGVAKDIAGQIEFASQDAAEPALACLQSFLGPRYGATIARTVAGDAGREFGIDTTKTGAEVTAGGVLRQSGEGIAGAAILLMRRQLATLSQRIGARIVGSIVSRLVLVVADGIGLVLLAKTIYDLRNGVLPIVAEEMKSKPTREKVQEELAKAISGQIGEHAREIGAKAADRIVDIWMEFRRAHTKALEIAEGNEKFRAFLDQVRPEQLGRLDEVVALILAGEGESGLPKRLDDGTLEEAVERLPAPAMEVARETRSLDLALRWNAVAGDLMPKVIENELYRRAKPDSFTKASLSRILAIDDRLAVSRLAAIGVEARDTLFGVEANELKLLARNLQEAELESLARYLSGLAQRPREIVLRAVAANPSLMQTLASARVRGAIVSSLEQETAVSMMLRAGGFDPVAALSDLRAAVEGRIKPLLIWEKYPYVVVAMVLGLLMLLGMLRRLLVPQRRARSVAPHTSAASAPDGTPPAV